MLSDTVPLLPLLRSSTSILAGGLIGVHVSMNTLFWYIIIEQPFALRFAGARSTVKVYVYLLHVKMCETVNFATSFMRFPPQSESSHEDDYSLYNKLLTVSYSCTVTSCTINTGEEETLHVPLININRGRCPL